MSFYISEVKVHLIGSCNNGLGARGCDMNFEIAFDPRAQRPVAEVCCVLFLGGGGG